MATPITPLFAQGFPSPSTTSLLSSPHGHSGRHATGHPPSLSEKFSLPASPAQWGMANLNHPEPDDVLHNPDPNRDRSNDQGGSIFTVRGFGNLGCLFVLVAGIMMLFAGYPILSHFLARKLSNQGGFNLGGINATGQIAKIPGNWGLIDLDTPKSAYTKNSYFQPEDEWVLVFSDEFNEDGRTFYPGDDPYWEAVDLHYWGTNDLEWYDPQQVTTANGSLSITLERVADLSTNHNMKYKAGMVQSWNKFCFTGGLIEAAVNLPGDNLVHGLWPALWTMGNLGRAGFGATLEGLWPFSYDSCDVGTLPNQTYPGTNRPLLATTEGDPDNSNVLSYMPGQRLSSCTCPGESHPGPMRPNGSYVGRAAPEIDLYEATVTNQHGWVSQSAQWAPYNARYEWYNNSDTLFIPNTTGTMLNTYVGGVWQQTTSGLSYTNQLCYERVSNCFSEYGFEYKPGFDGAYISWINDGQLSWTMKQAGLAPDPLVEIGPRPIPLEPMYIIANLGFSENFGGIDFNNIILPATMRVDWIRVYQPANARNVGCDPKNAPTMAYIETYKQAYTNFNLTTWRDNFGQSWPKNRLMPGGCS